MLEQRKFFSCSVDELNKFYTMNIQTRKLNVINYIINLDDEIEFRRIEAEILKNNKLKEKRYKPFTQEELLARVKESLEDYQKGNIITQEKLEDESEKW